MSRKGKKKTPIKKNNTLDFQLIIPDDSPKNTTKEISTEKELNDSTDSAINLLRGISKERDCESGSVSGSVMSVTEEGDVHVVEMMETEPPEKKMEMMETETAFPLPTEKKVGMMEADPPFPLRTGNNVEIIETDPPFPLRTEETVGLAKENDDNNEVSEITYVTESSPEPVEVGAELSVFGAESSIVGADSTIEGAESTIEGAESGGTPMGGEGDEIVLGSSQEECSIVSSPSGSLVGEKK